MNTTQHPTLATPQAKTEEKPETYGTNSPLAQGNGKSAKEALEVLDETSNEPDLEPAPREAPERPAFLKDAKGNLIAVSNIRPIDRIKDELVNRLFKRKKALDEAQGRLRDEALSEIEQFVSLSAAEHGVKMSGDKGNVTLVSFDGSLKVDRRIADKMVFNEGLSTAAHLFNEALNQMLEGSSQDLRTIVQKAFEQDADGNVSPTKVMTLCSYEISKENTKWHEAVEVARKSLCVASTRVYLRFYQRNPSGAYELIGERGA